MIRYAGIIRFDRQTLFPAMITLTIIIVLLTLLVATDPDSDETHWNSE